MKRWLIGIGLVIAAIVVFLLWRSPERAEPARAQETPSERSPPPSPPSPSLAKTEARANETPPARLERANTAPVRVELPRPQVAPKTEPVQIARASGLADKRGAGGVNAAAELEALNYGMETLDEDIQECLEQWTSSSSTITGRAVVGFQVAPGGLTSAWLDGADAMPFGPRTCIANAVYGIDWSNIVEKPAEITRRFELE